MLLLVLFVHHVLLLRLLLLLLVRAPRAGWTGARDRSKRRQDNPRRNVAFFGGRSGRPAPPGPPGAWARAARLACCRSRP